MKIKERVHKMSVLIACGNTGSERSDELARPRNLFRAFTARGIHEGCTPLLAFP